MGRPALRATILDVGGDAQLSPQQMRFAEAMDARPGMRPSFDASSVFMYRDDPFGADRWLVDSAGNVLDAAHFVKSPDF